jgi:hypothetical protein
MFASTRRRDPALPARLRAAGVAGGSPRHMASALQAAALLGVVLLLAWTHVFLGIHELKHIGKADASACTFAPIASTLGGCGTVTAPGLPAPPDLGLLALPAAPASELLGEASTQQARAPPVVS